VVASLWIEEPPYSRGPHRLDPTNLAGPPHKHILTAHEHDYIIRRALNLFAAFDRTLGIPARFMDNTFERKSATGIPGLSRGVIQETFASGTYRNDIIPSGDKMISVRHHGKDSPEWFAKHPYLSVHFHPGALLIG